MSYVPRYFESSINWDMPIARPVELVRYVSWREPHCENCRTLREHYLANPNVTCHCDQCIAGAQCQADLVKDRKLNP